MKQCIDCKETKRETEFGKRNGKRRNQCKNCLNEKARTYYNKTYKEKQQLRVKENKRKNYLRYINKKKELAENGCYFCGYNRCLSSLDFHHKDESTKRYNVSRLGYEIVSKETFLAEIDKCILVCSNCHHELHEGLLTI